MAKGAMGLEDDELPPVRPAGAASAMLPATMEPAAGQEEVAVACPKCGQPTTRPESNDGKPAQHACPRCSTIIGIRPSSQETALLERPGPAAEALEPARQSGTQILAPGEA